MRWLSLLIAFVTISCCAPRIYVGTSTLVDSCKLPCGFTPGTTFTILPVAGRDPLLDSEMTCKIDRYLTGCGYDMVDASCAEYQIQYSYETTCCDRLVSVPYYVPYWGCYGCGGGWGCCSTRWGTCGYYDSCCCCGTWVFAPEQVTCCTSYLDVKVIDGQKNVIWEGSASVGGCVGSDIRRAMDYLVVSAFYYFGVSSGARRCLQYDPCCYP